MDIKQIEKDKKKIEENPEDYAKKLTIKDLEILLRELSSNYYNSKDSFISDPAFDRLKDELEKRNPKSKFLKEIGAPPKKDKIQLPFPMMSLDKIKSEDSVKKYVKKFPNGPYVLSDKLDGVSAMIYNNVFYSRGDGIVGQDITNLLKQTTSTSPEKNMAVRGELIITKKDFEKIKDKTANARNAVAGIVNSKHPDKEILKYIKFVAYNIIVPEYDQESQYIKLKQMGFDTPDYVVVKKLDEEYLKEYFTKRRKESKYEVDGIVVTDSSKEYSVTSGNPDHSVAFKMMNDVFDVVVKNVIWNPSRDGYLKPKIEIEPISTQGVTITFATAFNAKYIVDNNLGIGSIVQITRSGDVIPYIVKVIKGTVAKMPEIPYKWNETNVDVIVKDIFNSASDTIKIKQLDHFFGTLEIKYIGEGILAKLVEEGYDTIYKILTADKKKLVKIEGIGEKLVEKIYKNINEKMNDVKLETLMYASNIFGRNLGEKKIKLIVDRYPDIMEQKWDNETFIEKLNEIEGFRTLTSTRFVENIDSFKKFLSEIAQFVKIKQNIQINTSGDTNKLFSGKTVVFTGFRDNSFEDYITTNGGKISSSVSTKTSLLVYAPGAGGKLQKALELGIETMTKEEFEKKYLTKNIAAL